MHLAELHYTGNEKGADHDEQHLGDVVDEHRINCSGNACVDEGQSSSLNSEVGCRVKEGEDRGPGKMVVVLMTWLPDMQH